MNTETITLPSGNTVVLRDPKSIRHKDRKKVYEATGDKTGALAVLEASEALIAVFVESWSFSALSLPSFNIEVLGELEPADFDVLSQKVSTYVPFLFPNTSEASGSELGDATPFPNSNDSLMS